MNFFKTSATIKDQEVQRVPMMSQGGIRVVSNLGEDGESDVPQGEGGEDLKNPIREGIHSVPSYYGEG